MKSLFNLLSITTSFGDVFPDKEYVVTPEGFAGDHDMINLVEDRFNAVGIDILDVVYSREGHVVVFKSLSTNVVITVGKIAKDASFEYLEELARDYRADLEQSFDDILYA